MEDLKSPCSWLACYVDHIEAIAYYIHEGRDFGHVVEFTDVHDHTALKVVGRKAGENEVPGS